MDNDLISRAKAKEMLQARRDWILIPDKCLALDVLDEVPAINTETEEVGENE